ncbi:MAG: NAD(P)-dependent methylenetetrahydromethanopterin dehydrogenase [Janthinobacterium lividum]
MADKQILHMLSPLKQVSPFDVNMAVDAGYDAVVPYANITADDVLGLVQDAIFSRPPKLAVRTGIFIGGRDAIASLDMLEAAKKAMVPPFIVSVFADPAGSFTTAAALVAHVERQLKKQGKGLEGQRIVVYGATGVVGFASGVIAALEGAKVVLTGHDGTKRVTTACEEIQKRFGVTLQPGDGSTEDSKAALLKEADAAFCCARAGVQVLSRQQILDAPDLLVAADVNAVPPMGVEGLDVQADGVAIGGHAVGIGALAIGHTKYRTEFGLFRRMIETDKPVAFDFRDAFKLARDFVAA